MLLVDHHQPEPLELHVLLDQRVGPDDDVRGAVPGLLKRVRPRGAPQPPDEEDDGHPERVQEPAQREVVLPREDLGRGHQRALSSSTGAPEECARRDDRLSGSDIPLEQAVHRVRPGQIPGDLVDGAVLRLREGERQALVESGNKVAGVPVPHRPRFRLRARFLAEEQQLEEE